MTDLELPLGQLRIPHFPVPDGETVETWLRKECERGLRERYGTVTPELQKRLDYELGVIISMGYAGYFLIVADFVRFAREQRIQTTCRGSAPGSIVTYTLYITPVDPIAYGLPFERFLNPDRVTMPDIDVDFEDERRDEVINYVSRKYGSDHVAQIITFGTMLARAAIRDVGRVLGYSYGEVDRVAKAVPNQLGIKLDEALEISPDLKGQVDADPGVKRMIDFARQLEGVARNASTHAAGVVISREPLTELMPLQKATNSDALMTQYEMHGIEALGLLKFDFLGLSNLTILRHAVDLVRQERAIEIDLDRIPLDDAATFELLASGETTGIFQLESAGMRRYIRELKPTSVLDLAAMVALFRPGPMDNIPAYIRRKHGQEPVTYLHPLLEPYLEKTYGIFVYQEDIMAAAIALGGFTGPEADTLGYAIRKKKSSVLRAQKEKFVTQAAERGVRPDVIDAVFTAFEPFERYGFNKAHATCYGLIAYQTAYLKANYTVEYMTAVLTAFRSNEEKVAAAVAECRRMGIEVLPPDVHRSDVEFTVEGPAIRFGLLAVKNVGQSAIESIVAAREAGGEFKSLRDFCERVDLRLVNSRVIEALAWVGALSAFGHPVQIIEALPTILPSAQAVQQQQATGQLSAFDLMFAEAPGRGAPAADRGAAPRAAPEGEGAPRAVPLGAPDGRGRRAGRGVRDRLQQRPEGRVARRPAGRDRRDRDRLPDGDHEVEVDDGDRDARGPPGHDRGRRLPADVRDDGRDLDRGGDPPRRRAGRPSRRGRVAARRRRDGLGRRGRARPGAVRARRRRRRPGAAAATGRPGRERLGQRERRRRAGTGTAGAATVDPARRAAGPRTRRRDGGVDGGPAPRPAEPRSGAPLQWRPRPRGRGSGRGAPGRAARLAAARRRATRARAVAGTLADLPAIAPGDPIPTYVEPESLSAAIGSRQPRGRRRAGPARRGPRPRRASRRRRRPRRSRASPARCSTSASAGRRRTG